MWQRSTPAINKKQGILSVRANNFKIMTQCDGHVIQGQRTLMWKMVWRVTSPAQRRRPETVMSVATSLHPWVCRKHLSPWISWKNYEMTFSSAIYVSKSTGIPSSCHVCTPSAGAVSSNTSPARSRRLGPTGSLVLSAENPFNPSCAAR